VQLNVYQWHFSSSSSYSAAIVHADVEYHFAVGISAVVIFKTYKDQYLGENTHTHKI
jgi:hypothetical protein